MSKLWTNQFEERCKSAPRGLSIGRGIFSLCLTFGLFVSAASAWAAEVVEVRVGRHPEFTRLVFELDRAAGYRIQRTDAGADSELVISLEASSMPRNLRSSKTLIEQVNVTPNGSRSVARIQLTEEGFRLKEMILSNPPRIVLDLVSEKAVARATTNKSITSSTASRAAATAKAKAQAEAKAKAQAQAQAKAEAEAKAKEQAIASAKAAAAAKAKAEEAAKEAHRKLAAESQKLADAAKSSAASAKNSASAAADRAMVTAKTTVQATAESAADAAKATTEATTDAVTNAAEKSKEMASNAAGAASDKVADAKAKVEELSFDEIVDRNSAAPNAPAPNAKPEAKPKTPRPMVAKTTTDDDGGWLTWALVAAGALVVGGAALLFARRRGDGEEVDFSEDENEVDFGDDEATVMTGDQDENPFAGLAGATADADATTIAPIAQTPFAEDDGMDGEATTIVPLPDDEKESETMVFESVQENDMDDMEVISRDQVNESLGGAMPPVGGVPEEFQQMMRDMNSRMQALESRCEELVDARDRLERQVAAQTEELRVQRAAIARTQRAVRNLARPEDAGEEEATEPALRDPNQ